MNDSPNTKASWDGSYNTSSVSDKYKEFYRNKYGVKNIN